MAYRIAAGRKKRVVAALFALTSLLVADGAAAARRALVVGNDNYLRIPALRNATADAKAMASKLSESGFEVSLKLDLSEREMKAAIRNFKMQLTGGDEAVFFFSGHGVQLGGSNYLLPVDIDGEHEEQVRDEAIPLQRILDDLQDQKTRFALAIIDACRDNPFKDKGKGRSIGTRGLAPTSAATGQMVIFSAGSGQQALDRLSDGDGATNGLFTRVFLGEMDKPNLSVDRMLRNVRGRVVALAKSVGHEQVPAIYDQSVGDFYFKREALVESPAPALIPAVIAVPSPAVLAAPSPAVLTPPTVPPPIQVATAPMSVAGTSRLGVVLATLADRFADNRDGTVLDKKSNLTWQRCSVGQQWVNDRCVGEAMRLKWDEAKSLANDQWRLPTKDELKELVYCGDDTQTPLKDNLACPSKPVGPAVASGFFSGTQAEKYWSGSPVAAGSRNTWYVNFVDGTTDYDFKHNAYFVRLVRQTQ